MASIAQEFNTSKTTVVRISKRLEEYENMDLKNHQTNVKYHLPYTTKSKGLYDYIISDIEKLKSKRISVTRNLIKLSALEHAKN